jgi:hypothetical protein
MEKKIQEKTQSKKDSSLENIKDNNLKEILLLLISKEIINPKKIKLQGDLNNSAKQEIEEAIKEKFQSINEKFSELRKSGKDLGVLNFKLMMIPLKIKVFLATYEKKDAENLIKRMEYIDNEINPKKK